MAPLPTSDPCGTTDADKDGIKDACDTNDGSRPPVAFKTVNATVVSGEVFVKLPAGAARAAQAPSRPRASSGCEGAQTIPVGSTLDTAKGRVWLRTASDTRKHVQSGEFFRGRFVVRQVRKPRGKAKKRSTKLITELAAHGFVVLEGLSHGQGVDLGEAAAPRSACGGCSVTARARSAPRAATPRRPCAGRAGASRTAATGRS